MLVRTAQEHEEIRQTQAQLQLKIAAAEQEQAGLVNALASLSQTNSAMLATTRCCSRVWDAACLPACLERHHVQEGSRVQPPSLSANKAHTHSVHKTPQAWDPASHVRPCSAMRRPQQSKGQQVTSLCSPCMSSMALSSMALRQSVTQLGACRPKGDADLKSRTAELSTSQREASALLLEADEDMGRLQVQAAGLQDELDELHAKLAGATEALAALHRREVGP